MRGHGGVEARATREESLLLCLVLAENEAHELGHAVPVIIGRAEGVLLDGPPGREDDKVCHSHADLGRLAGEDGEDGGVGMVKGGGVDDHEAGQVVPVGHIIAVPRDHVEGREVLLPLEEVALVLGDHSVIAGPLLKGSHRVLKVPGCGEPVGSDGTQIWELKVAIEHLTDVATAGAVRKADREEDPTLNDTNVVGWHLEMTKLSLNVKGALLGNYSWKSESFRESNNMKVGERKRDQ